MGHTKIKKKKKDFLKKKKDREEKSKVYQIGIDFLFTYPKEEVRTKVLPSCKYCQYFKHYIVSSKVGFSDFKHET